MRWIVLEVFDEGVFQTYTMDTFEDAYSIFMADRDRPGRKCCLIPEGVTIPKNFVPGKYYNRVKIEQ